MKYLETTPELIAEYLASYTGHPSNVRDLETESRLPDGSPKAARFFRYAKRGKPVELRVAYPWFFASVFSVSRR